MKQMGSLFFTGGMQYHYSDKYFPYSGIWLYGVCLGGFCRIWSSYASLLFVGQKKYPINYDLKAIGNYVVLALVLYIVSVYLPIQNIFLLLGVRTLLLLLFVAYIVKTDFPLQQIPVINRYIKK